jgi:hypothetical protein
MMDWTFVALVSIALCGWAFWLVDLKLFHRRPLMPIGSRIVDRLYRMARWTVAIARASDVALVEYRAVTSKPSDSFADEIEILNRGRV